MQALPMILQVGGQALSAYSQLRAGNEARKSAYGAAHEEEAAAAAQELRIRESARKAIGEQVAAQFSNGFLGGTGSALDALAESQINATMDALQVRRDAMAKARALRAEGDQRSAAGKFGAAEAILGAASSVIGMKSDWAAVKPKAGS